MRNRPMQSPLEIAAVPPDAGDVLLAAGQCQAEGEAAIIRLQFALSPRQAKLTALLFAGRSVKEAALALGITEGSARQYLKEIFRKTGARRQADLVRIVHNALLPQA
jgi:DNA-binding CsgD family transcriptional regulator